MQTSTITHSSAPTFVLAGRNDDGVWHEIATSSVEPGETPEDARTYLETMAQGAIRSYIELAIMTELEFARLQTEDSGPEPHPSSLRPAV
jgi:hypothetical protein